MVLFILGCAPNLGVCVAPGNCSCIANYEGLRCDIQKGKF